VPVAPCRVQPADRAACGDWGNSSAGRGHQVLGGDRGGHPVGLALPCRGDSRRHPKSRTECWQQ
jgi:hypothetical protein